ncbi:MAG: hypothetical protein GXC73_14640 [Chitinophagaceae bacterium]|nr:hypothetical protein [Chitinophagaceae bacterium]
MKRIAFLVSILLCQYTVFAQISLKKRENNVEEFRQAEKRKRIELYNKLKEIEGFDKIAMDDKMTNDSLIKRIEIDISNTVDLYKQKRLFIFGNDSLKNKEELAERLTEVRDSLIKEKKELIRLVKYWKRYERSEEPKQRRNFFPAYYGSQAVRFFEGDTVHQKLFQNNLVNFNPGTKKMVLYTEAVNDYFGPFRAGIGFQIKNDAKIDSLGTVDSTTKQEKKVDMLSAVQNGGGDLSMNLKYPIKKSSSEYSTIQHLLYVYGNTGFSLPVLNKASDDFLFNYDIGAELFLYVKGFNDKITFYAQFKAAYYGGNKNFRKVILDADKNDPTNFFMVQSSLGLDFMDGYRLRVDLFGGSSFARRNFPASITFVIRPGK